MNKDFPNTKNTHPKDHEKSTMSRRNLLRNFGLGTFSTSALASFDVNKSLQKANSQDSNLLYDPSKTIGKPAGIDNGYGTPSPFSDAARKLKKGNQFSARTLSPLDKSFGILTPSGLHFERHHAGIPSIDPNKHFLLIHGFVKTNKVFSMSSLMRYPSKSAFYFIECSGNAKDLWKKPSKNLTVQDTHGMMSTSEWTGVPLKIILEDIGLDQNAKWIIAEGSDASRLARSIPIEKCLDDALLAYAQNGELLRPEQGFPLRLILPGWEGNTQIKWLRRLQVSNRPYMTQQETSKYTDLLPNGKSEQFTFIMGVNSVITHPSGGMQIKQKGYHEISGLAWSGFGKIAHVEISTDGGKKWSFANLQNPVLPKCHTRFRFHWNWDGKECIIQSRSKDEFGNQQISRQELFRIKGRHAAYHMNAIHSWKVKPDGQVQLL